MLLTVASVGSVPCGGSEDCGDAVANQLVEIPVLAGARRGIGVGVAVNGLVEQVRADIARDREDEVLGQFCRGWGQSHERGPDMKLFTGRRQGRHAYYGTKLDEGAA